MKKILLTGAMLMALSFSVKAQVLESENFDGLTVGNVTEDLTGVTPGQGDYLSYVGVNGDESDFQIIPEGQSGNGLEISGGDLPGGTTQATDNRRFLWKTGLNDAWLDREDGNNLITVEYYFNSAVVNGSTSLHRTELYAAGGGGETMGGFEFNAATGRLSGLIYYEQNGQDGTYNINFATGGYILPEEYQNTWIRLGFAINPATGTVIWASPDILEENPQTGDLVAFQRSFVSSVAADLEPLEFDFVVFPGAANNTSSSAMYDGVTISAASDLSEWLSVKPVVASSTFAVYPNPTSNVVNVNSNNALVNAVNFTDLNGRVVKSAKFNGVTDAQVNISDLASGVYMMNISSDKGTTVKKIVKN